MSNDIEPASSGGRPDVHQEEAPGARELTREQWWGAFREGWMIAMRGPVFFLALTFLGIGSLAHEADLSAGVLTWLTLLIWAGPAQVIFIGAIMNGVALPAVALSVSLSSVRLLPLCVSLLASLRRPGQKIWLTLYVVHNIAVTAWVESVRRLPQMPVEKRIPWFMGLTHALYLSAILAGFLGFALAASLPHALAAGLLFVTPIYFTIALLRNSREMIDWLSLAFGFALAPVMRYALGSGTDLLALGLVGGTGAWLVQRFVRARRETAR